MRPGIVTGVLLWVGALSSGCADVREVVVQRMFGTCSHTYRSGVVALTSAQSTGGVDGVTRSLPQLVVGQIRLNDRPVDPNELQGLVNAAPGPQGLECTLPCSFGTETGKWQFTAIAPGYAGRSVNVGAHYAVFGRGCPSYNDKGTEVRVSLEPASPR